ncbi:MAG: hypothetical protein QHC90_30315 [Shinella sp.]|nr:hypothetical protein [Shinella sp.]
MNLSPRPPTDLPETAAEDEIGDAVASLAGRLMAARILREHHVWEALRCLPSLQELRREPSSLARFRTLMASDALVEAVLFLIAAARPACRIADLAGRPGAWLCRIAVTGGCATADNRQCFVSASHRDRAAALLSALLASHGANARYRGS